jgi:hypothetical protein
MRIESSKFSHARHERDEHVAAEGELAHVGRRPSAITSPAITRSSTTTIGAG